MKMSKEYAGIKSLAIRGIFFTCFFQLLYNRDDSVRFYILFYYLKLLLFFHFFVSWMFYTLCLSFTVLDIIADLQIYFLFLIKRLAR